MLMSLCVGAQFVEDVLGEEAGASGGRLPQGHQTPRAASGPQATGQALQGAALGAAARLRVPAPCRQRRADRSDQRIGTARPRLPGAVSARRSWRWMLPVWATAGGAAPGPLSARTRHRQHGHRHGEPARRAGPPPGRARGGEEGPCEERVR